MSSLYIGVFKALYEYTAQADEELSIQPGDLLYLLERSDVDDWWKVKKRVLPVGDEEADEPVGLVPSNYIDEAPEIKTATALYDYDKQTEEELSFQEGDQFNIYDLNDPDWLLVGDKRTNTLFGFIPSNYIEMDNEQDPETQIRAPLPISSFDPPPTHKDRTASATPQGKASYSNSIDDTTFEQSVERKQLQRFSFDKSPEKPQRKETVDEIEEEAPPPMPDRPGQLQLDEPSNNLATRAPTFSSNYEEEEDIEAKQEHNFDGDFFTWYIDEVDGRKKRAVIFSIGRGMIIIKPNTTNPKKLKLKSASSLDNEWHIKDLVDFSHEKKHLFLELKNPAASIELHTGSKDVAEAISSILGDLKGAESAKGLREVAKASKASTGASNKKIGRLLYDFEAQGNDELMSKEGDEIYIVNDTKSKEWWMCENIETGKQGVVPSSYIEIIGTSNLEKLTDLPQRKKSTRVGGSSKGRVVDNAVSGRSSEKNHRHRTRDERDRIRERDRIQRDKQLSSPKRDENDKLMPNLHRVRTWIDSSGSFKVEAEFLGCVEGKVHLHKTNGVKIAVAATKLSIEDLEYVEKVTGTSLEAYKQEVSKQNLKRSKSVKSSGVTSTTSTTSATAAINNISPPQPSLPKPTTSITTSEPEYDWFEFFLACGVDIGNCQRYALNFSREQMDENILEDITPSLLRTLGLREGDILRVMKFLDNKFNRKKASDEGNTVGGLFTEPTGALKNNSTSSEISKVNANALPSPQKVQEQSEVKQPQPQAQNRELQPQSNRFEDDAWAVKPAARSTEDLSRPPSQSSTPQYTGSLQDLVNIKPLKSTTDKSTLPALPKNEQQPSAPALVPVRTGTLIQPGQKFTVQNTGSSSTPQQTSNLIPVQKTGTLVPVQRTGGLIPIQTTGFITAQPTGFVPITSEPTGFVPIQQTGGLQPQVTFGIVPLQTGLTTFAAQRTGPQQQQKTGGIGAAPITTFGQVPFQPIIVPLQNGTITMPQTTFGEPLSLQTTGPLIAAQRTGGLPSATFDNQPIPLQRTGPSVPAQIAGGFVPQSTFGRQITGGFVGTQANGGMPQTSFSQQPTGGYPQNSFGGQPIGNNLFQQPTYSIQPSGIVSPNYANQSTGGFPQTSFNSNLQLQPSFGQQQANFVNFQQQPMFAQSSQPSVDQVTNMFQNAGINGPNSFNQQQQPFPNTTFGQQSQFEGFNSQPLQAQPTGAGFGNAPSSLQSQQTGRRANLQAATPDNPFGF